MNEQAALPLESKPAARFVIPDDPVVTLKSPSSPESAPAAPAAASAESPKSETQDTAESATAADQEAKPAPELTPEQLAAKRERRAQNKLEKAYRVRAEALAKADLLEKRLAELEAKAKPQESPQAGEPTLAQFDYDPEKYAAAKADFAKTQTAKELEAKQRTEAQQQANKKLLSDWEEKATRGSDKYDDWDEKVGDIKPTMPFIAAMMEADIADDIAYHLGTHPKEAQRIASLSPLSQIREIGKLEAKLLAKAAEPKTPSKAPAPVVPLTGAGTPVTSEPSDNDDIGQWIKKRQKQVHGKR
jgi:hypothetical protein